LLVAEPRGTIELRDPRSLRALAHPTRLALVGLLRREGALTATHAGELIGESAASCSFHLRQLAKYGLVEEAGGGRGRERPWRATAWTTSWPSVSDSPELAAAAGALTDVVAGVYGEQVRRWLEVRRDEPPEWQEAALFGDMLLYLTADELSGLGRELHDLGERYAERTRRPELRPSGSRAVSFIAFAFPSQEPKRG
jgi:DNA-binding transcriptional ArsR family regulator